MAIRTQDAQHHALMRRDLRGSTVQRPQTTVGSPLVPRLTKWACGSPGPPAAPGPQTERKRLAQGPLADPIRYRCRAAGPNRLEIAITYDDDMFTTSDVHHLMDTMYRSLEGLLNDAEAQARPEEDRHV